MGHRNLQRNWPIIAFGSLHPDLRYLLFKFPGNVVEIKSIARMSARGESRACYQVRLESGDYIKARLYASREIRTRVTDILETLENPGFTCILDSHGRATVEEWIPGKLVSSMRTSPKQARVAGKLLGSLHRTSNPAASTKGKERDVEWHLGRAKINLNSLCKHTLLSPATTGKLIEAAKLLTPANADIGIVHMDFCADNMVWTSDEKLVVIDNERFRYGPLDFDLARCFMRWPLTAAQNMAFRDGYENYRSLESFDSHNRFWLLCALAHSAWYALQSGVSNDQTLKFLARLAVDDGRPTD